MLTTVAAPSAVRTFHPFFRRPTSARSLRAASTGSTTACCSGRRLLLAALRWRYHGLHQRVMFARWACPCPQADVLIATTFQIPVHPGLDPAAPRYITKAVRAAASEGNDQ